MGLRGRNNLIAERFFFVTTTIVRFAHVFTNDRYCDILVRNIKHYQNNYKFGVLGYVIMPSHFHWLVQVNPEFGTISDIMRDLKKYSAWDIMEVLEKDKITQNDIDSIFSRFKDSYTKLAIEENDIKLLLKNYIIKGGYPRIVREKNLKKCIENLSTNYKDVIYSDIKSTYSIRKPQVMELLLVYLARNTSNILIIKMNNNLSDPLIQRG